MTARGIRNNNPFNMDFNPAAFERDPWRGECGLEDHSSPRFTTFESPVYGIRAGVKLIRNYKRLYGLDTVRGILDRFAPAVENNTDAYINHVAGAIGCGPDDPFDCDDPDVMLKLARAIIRHECGGHEYDEQTLADGVQLGLA